MSWRNSIQLQVFWWRHPFVYQVKSCKRKGIWTWKTLYSSRLLHELSIADLKRRKKKKKVRLFLSTSWRHVGEKRNSSTHSKHRHSSEVTGRLHDSTVLRPGNNPGTHRIGSWVGPIACLDVMGKIKIPGPFRDSNRGTPNPCLSHYKLPNMLFQLHNRLLLSKFNPNLM